MVDKTLNIVKIGGNVINNQDLLTTFLKDFASLPGPKILVHGGGSKATEISERLGIEPEMIDGRRITDESTLDVVTMVFAGLLNKNMVSKLQQLNCNALGLTGADANCIEAHKRITKTIDYGFAGDIDLINTKVINHFLSGQITPVFCAITHNKKGQLLNTNADTIAAKLAIAMSNSYHVALSYVFDQNGVLFDIDDSNSVIPIIDYNEYIQLIENKIIAGGMLPKLHNCFNALKEGVQKIKIGNYHILKTGEKQGTLLTL
jgi:acetylglutamate kinase